MKTLLLFGSYNGQDSFGDKCLLRCVLAQLHRVLGSAARLRRLPEASYAGAFFACWTRMEARLKAWGRGLAGATGGGTGDCSALTVHELAPGRGYAGALAVEGHDHRLVFWDLTCPC